MQSIRDIMRTEPISVSPATPVTEVLRLLIDNHISGVPVVQADKSIVGVLTEMDLLSLFWEDGVSVAADLMTKNPRSFSVDEPVVDVVDCLMANNFRRVLIHEDGKLVGLISRADLMPAILREVRARHPS